MPAKNTTVSKTLLGFFFAFFIGCHFVDAQIYYHDFGDTPITTYPYNEPPAVSDPNLLNSSWSNSNGTWLSAAGATGQSIVMLTAAGTNTITLTFDIDPNFEAEMTSFDFWGQSSASGPQEWEMDINGTVVGNGTVTTTGTAIGQTNVAVPITGLTGSVQITLTLTGASGAGNFRLDDFTLNGAVTNNCTPATVTDIVPNNGPVNTEVTITGAGFTAGAGVTEITISENVLVTDFTVVSDTELTLVIPPDAVTGQITIVRDGCPGTVNFTTLEDDCPDLLEPFISELYDHNGGSLGYVELYNPNDVDITFNGEYSLHRAGDIGGGINYNSVLPGTIGAQDTYIVRSGNGAGCTPTVDDVMGNGINANDQFFLRKNGVNIDQARAPGSIGYSVVRNPDAIAPSVTWAAADWTFNSDNCNDLDQHTADPGQSTTQANDIAQDPQSIEVCENDQAAFTIVVDDPTGVNYQWMVLDASGNWVNVVDDTNYSGATTATLTINNVPLNFDEYQYYCEVTLGDCTLVSNAAQLAVTPSPEAPEVTVIQPDCNTPFGSIIVDNPVGTGITYSIDEGNTFQADPEFTDLPPGTYNVIVHQGGSCDSFSEDITINSGGGSVNGINLDFEEPDVGTGYNIDDQDNVPGWNTTATDGQIEIWSADFANFPAYSGNQFVEVNANQVADLYQDITISEGTVVNCAFAHRGRSGTDTCQLLAGPPGGPYQAVGGPVSTNNADWSYNTETYTVPAGQPVTRFVFQSVSSAGPNNMGNFLDAVSFTTDDIPVLVNVEQPNCVSSTGEITVTDPVGADIVYSIDGTNFQSSPVFPDLAPGTYTITAENTDTGCISLAENIVIDPVPPTPGTPEVTVENPTCLVTSGTITVTDPLGADLTYTIDGINFQSSPVFTGVAPGTYYVTVQNAEECNSVSTITTVTTGNTTPPAVADVTVVQPDCDVAWGSITVNAPLGADLEYSIDGVIFDPNATDFTNLPAGTYNITVQNNYGCVSVTPDIIINPAPTTPNIASVVVVQPTCADPTGTISVTDPLGADLTYSIDGVNFQAGTDFTGLASGIYTVTVQNADSCTSVTPDIDIAPAPAGPDVANVSVTQPSCAVPQGSITVNDPLGVDLTYSIDGVNFQAGTLFDNLIPGIYTVTVQDAEGCASETSDIVIDPVPSDPDVADVTVVHPDCTTPTGSITVDTPLGAGLEYSIDGVNFQTTLVFDGLVQDTYTVTVQNADGCTSVTPSITIDAAPPVPAVPSVTVQQPNCTTTTGNITVDNPLGTAYTYSIDGTNYQAAPVFNNVNPGTYTLTVQNTDGCVTQSQPIVIDQAPDTPVAPDVTVTQPDCDVATGTITVDSPAGTGLLYSIDGANYQLSALFSGLAPDTYDVTVQNADGCISPVTTAVIDSPPAPAPDPGTITGTPQLCLGETAQFQSTEPNGIWSVGNPDIATIDGDGLLTSVANGTVQVIYTVGTVCTDTATITVTVNTLPQPALNNAFICLDSEDNPMGAVELNSGLSSSIYSFEWFLGNELLPDTSNSIWVGEPGDYTVVATNVTTGCFATATTTVGTSSLPEATAEVGADFSNNQTITVTVTGGSGNHEFQLDNGMFQDTPVFSNVGGGQHLVTVRDKNGCGEIVLEVYVLDYPNFFTPNGDGYNDYWNITGLQGQEQAQIYIFDRYGKLLKQLDPNQPGWDGNYNGNPLPATDYWFMIHYVDDGGAEREFGSHFALKR